MAYPYPQYYNGQPYPYQDQLSQLRNTPMVTPGMTGPGYRPDPGINWVQGEAGARAWMVAPGSQVLLMDSEAQRFYIKTVDPSGIPTMKTYEFTELTDNPAPRPEQYVTRAEFEQFVRSLAPKEVADA